MDQAKELDRRANEAFRAGNVALALEEIRRLTVLCPHLAGPRMGQAKAALKIGRAHEAVSALKRAVATEPAALTAHNLLTLTLYQTGRTEAAIAAAMTAIARHPGVPEFHLNLSVMLFEGGRMDEAAIALSRLLALLPETANAHSTLGQVHLNRGVWPPARAAFSRAARLDPEDVRAHLGLYYICEAQGDHELAAYHQAQALARQQLFSEAAKEASAPSILVLEAPGNFQANLPTGFFLSTDRYHLHRYVLVEGKPVPDLPAYDLVFNAVSEPDRTEAALRRAAAFIAGQNRPVLNDPAAVARTARDKVPTILAGMENLVIPRMERVARGEVAATIITIGLPVLIRPVGSHAGDDLEKITDMEGLAAYLEEVPAETFYVSRFVDYSSADGQFRKYRAILVDGEPYPCHMAIRDHWMIHYFNARMDLSAEKRAEEERFLADPIGALGEGAWNILREIGRRMGIDYFGIDFGMTQDGRVILFEVDVAAIVHLMDDKVMFAYKHRHVPRIFDAAHAMINHRLACKPA